MCWAGIHDSGKYAHKAECDDTAAQRRGFHRIPPRFRDTVLRCSSSEESPFHFSDLAFMTCRVDLIHVFYFALQPKKPINKNAPLVALMKDVSLLRVVGCR